MRGAAEGVLEALFFVEVFVSEEGQGTEDGDVHHLFG